MSEAIDLYDYLDGDSNDIESFINSLQVKERARLEAKIAAVKENGLTLLGSNVLTDTKLPQIKEIRVNTNNKAVRMLLCRGPRDKNKELTFLFGAFERDNKYDPKNALEIADSRRKQVEADPEKRRVKRS